MLYKKTDIPYFNIEKVTHENGTRLYKTPLGNVPSVTTILSETADKEGLKAWREWLGDEKADQEVKMATGLGSLMHEHLENWVMGLPRPSGNNLVRKMAKSMADEIINRGLVNVSEVWASEQPLYYPGLYAGTTDLIMKHKGILAVGDFKTTKKPKKDIYIEDYKLQIVAYGIAHNIMFGTDIQKGVIFMCSRDQTYQEWIVEGAEFEHYTDVWISRLEAYYKDKT